MIEANQQIGLDDLRLNRAGAHRDDRLAGENDGALRHGPDIACKAEIAQRRQKALGKNLLAAQEFDILFIKVQALHIFDDGGQPAADGKAAAVGHIAVENVEIDDLVAHAQLMVAVGHGVFIIIGQQLQTDLFFHRSYSFT